MPESVMRPHQVFSMRHVARALDGFRVPTGPFDPSGPWTATYDLVERAFKLRTIGALRLERRPTAAGGAVLRFQFRKQGGGGVVRAAGEVFLAADELSSTSGWSLETWVADRSGQDVAGTRARERVEVKEGVVRRTGEGLAARETTLTGPLTTEWGLFDAVQRLPRTPGGEWRFSLADRFGACLKPGQVLATGPALTVSLGGRSVWGEEARPLAAGTVYRPVEKAEGATDLRLQAYEHTGQGILPTTYWVDDAGRLVFAVSGMTGWVLNPETQI